MDLRRALDSLQDDPRFQEVVRDIRRRRDVAFKQCVEAQTADVAEPLRLEARAYDRIMTSLTRAGLREHQDDEHGTSGG